MYMTEFWRLLILKVSYSRELDHSADEDYRIATENYSYVIFVLWPKVEKQPTAEPIWVYVLLIYRVSTCLKIDSSLSQVTTCNVQ